MAEGKILSKTCSAPRGKGMPVLDPELVLRLSLLPTNTSAIEKHRMHHVTTLFIQQKYASVIPFPMVLARKLNFSKENVLDDLYQFPNWTIINKTVHYCSRLNICKLNKLIYKFQIHKMNCQTKIVSCMLHWNFRTVTSLPILIHSLGTFQLCYSCFIRPNSLE